MAIVEAQLQHGLFLDQKKIPKAGHENFLLEARELRFAQPECWEWLLDYSYPMVQVAKMMQAPSLDVFGKKTFSCPIPGITYKFALKVKLTENAYGWDECPVTLKMKTPDGKTQHIDVYLKDMPREKWLDLDFGFYSHHHYDNSGVMEFFVLEIEGPMKGGLVIAGVVFSPVPV